MMQIDRRGFLALLGATPAARGAEPAGTGRVRLPPGARGLVRLDTVRVCNTGYHAAATLGGLAPGEALDVRFDYDPSFPRQASAGFYYGGTKVGDAPRLQREWFGAMLNAGRCLRGRLARVTPATVKRSASWHADVLLDRTRLDVPADRPAEPGFGGPAAPDDEAFLRLVAGVFGLLPVWLQTVRVHGARPGAAAVGEPLHLVVDGERVWFETLAGERLGEYPASSLRLVATMLKQGVSLGALVVSVPSARPLTWAAVYLIG